ncbi:hypothetical protein BD626DRAFT_31501 [Schizophyllum amplum]|uniref:F-box domain-containing protein n=1 Tax=Schizophyllum amplum TaxID=97359 RepID=A0A550D0S5_9AGAR|nr:hypothetical protein BD626DRAFT_31501 [Auriculariopsis ampla]
MVILACEGQNLFPNLRDLYYEGPSSFTPCLPYLFRPALNIMTFLIQEEGWDGTRSLSNSPSLVNAAMELSMLTTLKHGHFPTITSLSLWFHTDRKWPLDELLSGWNSLEELDIHAQMDDGLISTMFGLPRLRMLRLRPVGRPAPVAEPQVVRTVTSSLRRMELKVNNLSWASNLVASVRKLEISELCIPDARNARALDVLLRSVQKSCSRQTLPRFNIRRRTIARSDIPADWIIAIGLQELRPLLMFESLVEVVLQASTLQFVLHDCDIEQLAKAWPRIQRLELFGNQIHTPTCTLVGLISFARHCKDLQYLCISVDASATNIPQGTFVDCAQTSLHRLYAYKSPVVKEAAVASFLSRFFPCIDTIVCKSITGRTDTYGEHWRKVMDLIPVFVEARRVGIHGGFPTSSGE